MTPPDRLALTGFFVAFAACFPRKWSIALMCLLACVANAWGQTPAYRSAVVSVGQRDPSNPNASFAGVGTVVKLDNGKAIVVSCAHIFESGTPCWVEWPTGRVPARLLGTNGPLDLAALYAEGAPQGVTELPVAMEFPQRGEQVEFVGRGGGQWKHIVVSVLGYTGRAGKTSQLVSDFTPISGDSGGPLIYKGRLAAVNWGYAIDGANKSQGTWAGQIGEFLTQCYGGSCQVPFDQGGGYEAPPMVNIQPQPQPTTDPQINKQVHDLTISFNAWVEHVKKIEGKPGPKGDKGDPGPAADTAALQQQIAVLQAQVIALQNTQPQSPNVDAIAEQVIKRIPPTKFEIYDNGKFLDSRVVPPGGTVPLERYSIGAK